MVDWIVRDKVRSSRRGEGRFHDLGIEIFCFYQWEKEERIDRSAEADNRRPTL
jgi:hypothetical protein